MLSYFFKGKRKDKNHGDGGDEVKDQAQVPSVSTPKGVHVAVAQSPNQITTSVHVRKKPEEDEATTLLQMDSKLGQFRRQHENFK